MGVNLACLTGIGIYRCKHGCSEILEETFALNCMDVCLYVQ